MENSITNNDSDINTDAGEDGVDMQVDENKIQFATEVSPHDKTNARSRNGDSLGNMNVDEQNIHDSDLAPPNTGSGADEPLFLQGNKDAMQTQANYRLISGPRTHNERIGGDLLLGCMDIDDGGEQEEDSVIDEEIFEEEEQVDKVGENIVISDGINDEPSATMDVDRPKSRPRRKTRLPVGPDASASPVKQPRRKSKPKPKFRENTSTTKLQVRGTRRSLVKRRSAGKGETIDDGIIVEELWEETPVDVYIKTEPVLDTVVKPSVL